MGFAEDKVYEYIKQNMPDFHCIRVNQLIRHLPCLSDADREEIAAYDDRKGNEHAVGELFVRLKCRRDWVRQFIRALRRNEQQDLADRVESEYNAHQVRAAFNSDLGDLKRPIQESELPEKGTDSSSTSRPKENVIRAPKPPSSVVTRTSLGIPGDTAGTTAREAQNALPGFPEGCQAFCNELDEEVELSKPGVLTSAGDGGREEPAERWPDAQETNGQYSGRSDRFFFSSAYSLGSNPLMISKSSIASSSTSRSPSNQPEENCYSSLSDHPPPTCAASNCSGGDEATKTSRDSLPPESSSTWDSTAVGTHEFRVVEYPSADLGEAASLRSGDSAYENPSPTFREHSRYQKGSSNKSGSPWNSEAPPGGSPQNVTGPRRGSDGTSFPLRDYVLPAAIAAFTSVVAFLFYKHLRN
ncbi:mitochondrial antiviral-signaling protein isoform X1 [Emydura macquarii macquarii]|uniref:mitochondrial antiviral-signaling protein isoform X1 n=1 Tax=Emydura macquarii macquarii TaxID=1129001 RepID=UPI00352AF242